MTKCNECKLNGKIVYTLVLDYSKFGDKIQTNEHTNKFQKVNALMGICFRNVLDC